MTCHATWLSAQERCLAKSTSEVDCASQEHFQKEQSSWYGELLLQLDDAAARQIREELSQLAQLTEPHVAHDLSQALPPGDPCCHGCQCLMCTSRVTTSCWHRVQTQGFGMPIDVALQSFQKEADAS